MDDRNERLGGALNNDFSNEPRHTGYVKWFDNQKKYGFIRRDNDSDVFVHFSSIKRQPPTLREYERVEFTVVPGKKGPEARDVVVLAEI